MKLPEFCWLFLLILLAGDLNAERPNIILVMADDQGWGDTGYNGHPVIKTPHLDAMASESLVFNRFYAAAPVCSPTRGSVLTGRHPIRIKITNHGRYMRPQEVTLAEELQAAGYTTGMFGKWHVGSAQKGSPVNPGNSGFDEWVIGLNFFDNDPYLSRNGIVEQIKGSGSRITIDETVQFLKNHKSTGRPMFAVAWLPSPHDPHQEKPAIADLYQGIKGGPYFAEITVLDEALGSLRTEIRRMGIEKNTILWYCSDNGGLMQASSGGRGRKGSIYEGGLRVPGILKWPARLKQGEIDIPASTLDMLPTLLSAAGIQRTGTTELDGIDLMAMIDNKTSARKKPLGFWFGLQAGQSTWSDRILKKLMIAQQAGQPSPHPDRLRKDIDQFPQFSEENFPGHSAWLDWPWKLHRIEGKKVTYEFYNLETHPMENKDLSSDPQYRLQIKSMQKQLTAWQRSVVRSLNGKDYPK